MKKFLERYPWVQQAGCGVLICALLLSICLPLMGMRSAEPDNPILQAAPQEITVLQAGQAPGHAGNGEAENTGAAGSGGSTDGELTGEHPTKKELGDGYGMKAASGIGKEWFEQAEALEDWCVGKTVEEVVTMPTYDKGDGRHTQVPDDVDLKTGCTIDIGSFLNALQEAADNAKYAFPPSLSTRSPSLRRRGVFLCPHLSRRLNPPSNHAILIPTQAERQAANDDPL